MIADQHMTVVDQNIKFVIGTNTELHRSPYKLDFEIVSVFLIRFLPVSALFKYLTD
jgi:hypothetical protein